MNQGSDFMDSKYYGYQQIWKLIDWSTDEHILNNLSKSNKLLHAAEKMANKINKYLDITNRWFNMLNDKIDKKLGCKLITCPCCDGKGTCYINVKRK